MARTKLGIALTVALWTAPVWMVQVTGCGGRVDEWHEPVQVADAGADADPELTTCCRLDNELGQRLNYMCGESISVEWAVARGYRCWSVP